MAIIPLPGVDSAIQGKWRRLSPARKLVCDLMHFAKAVPSIPSQRRMQLGEVVEARALAAQRISWCAIFVKAYALVAAERPELRRSYMPLLWPHLYEHPINVASFALEREYAGETGVFFAQVPRPERLSLADLDALVRFHKRAAIDAVPSFKRAMFISRLPLPLRRLIWWLGLYGDGALRGYFFGTFGISAVASQGAAALHVLSPLTTTINYGVLESDGSLEVRLVYDHRVLDGAPIARALVALEATLHGPIRAELLEIARHAPARQSESRENKIPDLANLEPVSLCR